ncbi:MAG: SDR family oxidoreductase [Candidatus Sericytochromatia bacterium]
MSQRQGAALITGGSKRLGRAMALCLAARGYDLAIHYHTAEAEAVALQRQLSDFGATTHLIQGDLTDPAFLQQLIQTAHTHFPKLNLLLNNASVFFPKTLDETGLDTLDLFLNMHLKAPLILSRDFAKICGQGNIVNMVDSLTLKNPVSYLPYILSKKALVDLTELSAKALGPAIRVNAIGPGYILPPVEGNEDAGERWIKKTPLQRQGAVTDITAALEALLDNPFLTGQVLWVDGGHRL